MVGRCGGAPVAGAADLLRHRSACRSELESHTGIGRPSPSLSTRAPRTEPPLAVAAHELLQHNSHCRLPAHLLLQPRAAALTLSCCSRGSHRSLLTATGAPAAALSHAHRPGELSPYSVSHASINPYLWCTAVRVCTAPWAAVRVAVCCYVSPRSHLSQLRAPRSTHPRAQAR